MKPYALWAASAALTLWSGIGMAQTVTTAQILPETREMLRHAISVPTVEGQGKVPAFAAYLAGKLKAGGFADADVQIIPVGETAALIANPNIQIPLEKVQLLHAALGLMSEAGELMNGLIESCLTGQPVDKINMREELGDIEWYTALGLREIGSSFEDAAQFNIAKLQKRYPTKFNSEDALNRDLDAEKVALTS